MSAIPHWFMAGSHPRAYSASLEPAPSLFSGRVARLSATPGEADGFGTLMQQFRPGALIGQRVRLSAWMRVEQVAGGVGLWMRVDGEGPEPLSFDNMGDRSLEGTTDWAQVEVVLDVPHGAVRVAIGVLLSGAGGDACFGGLRLEAVDRQVPVTGRARGVLPDHAMNLSFDEDASA